MSNFTLETADEIFEYLQTVALQTFPDATWSGLQEGSLEHLLAKLVAANSELLINNANFRSREAYLQSAELQRTLKQIAKNIGLTVRYQTGATTTLSITATDDVTIPKGTAFVSTSGLTFSTLAELVLSSGGSLSGTVSAIHATYTQITKRAQGNQREKIFLDTDDVIPSQLTVSVDGTNWTLVDDLATATSTSEIYLINFDERNRLYIQFGDGTYGKRLPADAEIIIDVYSGGGKAGNSVGVGAITSLLGTFTDSSNISTITNTTAATGGRFEDSINTMRSDIPANARSVSGIITANDGPGVLRNSLDWLLDAKFEETYSTAGTNTTPVVNVTALPTGTSVSDMSAAQNTALQTVLENQGLLGVSYTTRNAVDAPLEIEAEVKVSDRNVTDQTTSLIKNALNGTSTAPFNLTQGRFDSVYTENDTIDTIEAVDNVVRANLKRFTRIPQTIVHSGSAGDDSPFDDLEFATKSEDGYMSFIPTTTTDADVTFNRLFNPDRIGSTFATDNSKNWLEEQHLSIDPDDTNGPWIKTVSTKLSFKQLTRVWSEDQYNGTANQYNNKYILRVTWVDASSNPQEAYYHIDNTVSPDTITTVENASSPIDGTAITTLSGSGNTNINLYIYKDQTNGSTGTLVATGTGETLTISHNNANTLFFTANPIGKVPVNKNSFIQFTEAALDVTTGVYTSNGEILRARVDAADTLSTNSEIRVYTSPILAKELSFHAPDEFFSLSSSNITIRYI